MAELRLGRFDECQVSLESGFKIAPEDKNLKDAEKKLAEAKEKGEEEKKE